MTEREVTELTLEVWTEHGWVTDLPGTDPQRHDSARLRFAAHPTDGIRDLGQDAVVGAAFPVARSQDLEDSGAMNGWMEGMRQRLGEIDIDLASLGWERSGEVGPHWWSLRYSRAEPLSDPLPESLDPARAVRSSSDRAMGASGMREVSIGAVPLDPLARLLSPERAQRLAEHVTLARDVLGGRVVWNVNATASGGGVAEMLTALLAYTRGAGVDTRWLVLNGNPRFFRITKRLHNVLHGSPGDSGPLGEAEREVYESVLASNVKGLITRVRPGDIALLHDPQTAGMAPLLRAAGVRVVWRCHIGRDEPSDVTRRGWAFLEPYLQEVDATVFSRQAYVPDCVDQAGAHVIPPSIDPFSTKNVEILPADVEASLAQAGLVTGSAAPGSLMFGRRDGTVGTVRPHGNLLVAGDVIPSDARLVLQVSRWDRLKDMVGLMDAFAAHLDVFPRDAHLALVGPNVLGVSDDPEGAEVLFECVDAWKTLPGEGRDRIHLISLPMDDVGENAHLTNALQRHAAVVVQKSLVEGFGLTVTEAMWKHRPVVASAVGGIQDQIVDGRNGLLLPDPKDGGRLAELIAGILHDEQLANRLGAAAVESVREGFLGDRHLIQYVQLFAEILADAR